MPEITAACFFLIRSANFSSQEQPMGETIVVTSGKGGVGKTAFTANFGAGLALEGKKVCLVDADIGLRNLDIPLGLSNRVVFDIYDVIEGKISIDKALLTSKELHTLSFLPGIKDGNMEDQMKMKRFQTIVSELKKVFDYVIIDSPAGIETGFEFAAAPADKAIIVTTLDQTAVRDADRVIGILEERFSLPTACVLNGVHVQKRNSKKRVEFIQDTLNIDFLGIIEWNEVFINQRKPIVLNPAIKSGLEYRKIVRHYLGKPFSNIDTELKGSTGKKEHFIQKLFKRKGREKRMSQSDVCSYR